MPIGSKVTVRCRELVKPWILLREETNADIQDSESGNTPGHGEKLLNTKSLNNLLTET